METLYRLESFNFLEQTNKPCRKYVLNTGNALQRKDCVINTNKCTTFFPFFSIPYLKVIDADLKLFLYVRVCIKVLPLAFYFVNPMNYRAFYL